MFDAFVFALTHQSRAVHIIVGIGHVIDAARFFAKDSW
jgi:hypothetical protein